MLLESHVDNLPDVSMPDGGASSELILGKMRDLIVSELHGIYYQQTYRGNLFAGNQAAAGAVVPIYSNTTQQCGIFNPLGSGVNIILVKLLMTFVDTTGAAGGYCLGYVKGCGGSIATGSGGITVATLATPVNLNLSAYSGVSKAVFMSAAITTAAPAILMQLGFNQMVLTAATTSLGQWPSEIRFDGYPIVTQGTAVFFCGNIATLSKIAATFVWEESPA